MSGAAPAPSSLGPGRTEGDLPEMVVLVLSDDPEEALRGQVVPLLDGVAGCGLAGRRDGQCDGATPGAMGARRGGGGRRRAANQCDGGIKNCP